MKYLTYTWDLEQALESTSTKFLMEIITCNTSKPFFLLRIIIYDNLLSPSNLKRWKLTCFLHKKYTCTTSHILGASKVALSQGRSTFCHGSVLRIIISNIRSFIKNIKSTVPASKQPIKIKFIRKELQQKSKIHLRVGYYIKHQAEAC